MSISSVYNRSITHVDHNLEEIECAKPAIRAIILRNPFDVANTFMSMGRPSTAADVQPWKSIFAGSIAGSMSVLVCHPLDVIRTRIQLSSHHHAKLSLSLLYSGILPPLGAQSVYKAVIFGANSLSYNHLLPKSPTEENSMSSAIMSTFVSGLIAGMVVSFVVAPVEYIRTQQIMKIDTKPTFARPWRLWRNLTPTLLRDGPGVGFYFLVFEGMKSYIVDVEYDFLSRKVIAACCAGVSFWLWGLPFDNIKTVMEADSSRPHMHASFLSTSRRLYSEGGLIRFYQSLPVALARGIPSAAVTLTTFEYIVKCLDNI
jgi:solute carrier family 25 (mitochondrial carnitine/acylcarnitine transporter), member 20/29